MGDTETFDRSSRSAATFTGAAATWMQKRAGAAPPARFAFIA
jgi:hypothetical protein